MGKRATLGASTTTKKASLKRIVICNCLHGTLNVPQPIDRDEILSCQGADGRGQTTAETSLTGGHNDGSRDL